MKQFVHSFGKKCLYLMIALISLHFTSFSQFSAGTYYEGGVTVGPMIFLGDLGGHVGKGTSFLKDYNVPTTKFSIGAWVAAYPSEWLGVRFAVNYGHLEGDDAEIKGKGGLEEARKARNLNFRSALTEGFLALELYPTVFLENEATDVVGRLRPYGLLGLGVFHFNPQGSYDDPATHTARWVYLKPLHTEGEGFPEYPDRKNYALTQLNIPFGIGVKYFLSENTTLSFEIIHRKTFTDYIDDVSTRYVDPNLFYLHLPVAQAQIADGIYNKSPLRNAASSYGPGDKRGDPTQNDAYFTAGFKLGIRLGNRDGQWRNSTRCPILRF